MLTTPYALTLNQTSLIGLTTPLLMTSETKFYHAQKSCQLSHLDLENLHLKIEQWKKDDPEKLFLFRPFTESEPDHDTRQNSPNTLEAPHSSLLFIHQNAWQQQLLIKYGNTISLLDATYKTTKYELPLFFISEDKCRILCGCRICYSV